ncbi:hypothetical protein ACFL6G_02610 [candidate division KSB1 bacterium]
MVGFPYPVLDSRLKPAGKTSGRDYGNDWVHETKRMADAGYYKKEDAGDFGNYGRGNPAPTDIRQIT